MSLFTERQCPERTANGQIIDWRYDAFTGFVSVVRHTPQRNLLSAGQEGRRVGTTISSTTSTNAIATTTKSFNVATVSRTTSTAITTAKTIGKSTAATSQPILESYATAPNPVRKVRTVLWGRFEHQT